MKLMPINGDSDDDFESSHPHENELAGVEQGSAFPEAILESNPHFDNESDVLMAEPVSNSEQPLHTLGKRCWQLFDAVGQVCFTFLKGVRAEFNVVDACHALLFLVLLSFLVSQHTTIAKLTDRIEQMHTDYDTLKASVGTLQSQAHRKPTLSPTGHPTQTPTIAPTASPTKHPVATIGSRDSATVVTGLGKITFQTPRTIHIAQKTVGGTRMWSPKTTEVYVGDTVKWSWDTNENVVQSSSSFTPMTKPRFASGALSLKGSFVHAAKDPGTYYFASANTATMTGTLVVKPRVTVMNGNLDVPGNLTNHGAALGGTIYAIVLRSKSSSSTSYTVKYLRGHDGHNCVGAGASFSNGGGAYPPVLDIMKTAPFKTRTCPTPYCAGTNAAIYRKNYEAMYDLWQKLASARSINPQNSLCMPPKLAVELSSSTDRLTTTRQQAWTVTPIFCMD
jgi:plastocyanin